MTRTARLTLAVLALALALAAAARPAPVAAAPEGQIAFAAHVTLAPRWLDPAETESAITPFMVLYALHDAMVKPMPGGLTTPSLAESWTVSKDGVTYDFVLRNGVKFHSGEAITAEDVKFSFERYHGGAAKVLKDKVKEVRAVDARRVRFVLKEAWPDFLTFYGTTATGAGWVVPKKYVEKPHPYDPAKAKQLLAQAGYASGFDAGDLTPNPPYFGMAEAIANNLAQVGIRVRVRTMERAAFLTAWGGKSLKGIVLGAQGAGGNAATRIEGVATKNGTYAYGVLPEVEDLFQQQARELDKKKREEMLHQAQKILHDKVVFAPVWENGFIRGVSAKVDEPALTLIPAFPYAAPLEELRLKK